MEDITIMITWLGFFSAIFLSYFYFLRFRNKERMLLIEKNVDLSEIYKKRERQNNKFPWYMLGFILLGLGLGLVISFFTSYYLHQRGNFDHDFIGIIILCGLVFFGALGMIIGHNIEQKKKALRG